MMEIHQALYSQGKMLGRYRMLHLLGRGGMGEVWLAEDTELRRQVTVKLLPAVLASDEHYLHAFAYEARAAAALEHPHILAVHDFGEERQGNAVIPYLVLPYISGGSLRDRLRQGSVPVEESLAYLRQAGEAIDFAHSQQVLHRDIKPANMLLQDSWLFLADFGIAKLLSATTSRSSTHTGAGTPEYMAPEQARGHAEAASDRYSLAVTAYQLLTGKLPFRGETPYDILIKQLQQQPPSPRSFNPALSEVVEQVLLRGLAKLPAERPASCDIFVRELSSAWKKQQHQAADSSDATVLAPWSKRLREHAQTSRLPFSTSTAPTTWEAKQAALNEPKQAPTVPPAEAAISDRAAPAEPARRAEPRTLVDMATTPVNAPEPPTLIFPNRLGSDLQIETAGRAYLSGNAIPFYGSQPGAFDREIAPPPAPATSRPAMSRRSFLTAGGAGLVVLAAGGLALYSTLHSPSTRQTTAPMPGPHKFIPGIPLLSLTGHTRAVWNAVWDPTGRYLATGGEDHTVMVWDIAPYLVQSANAPTAIAKPLRSWRLANSIENNELSWSPDGRGLIVTIIGEENRVHYLDVFGKASTPTDYLDVTQTQSFLQPTYWYTAWAPHHNYFATSIFESMQVAVWQEGKTTGPLKTLLYDGPKTKDGFTLNTQEIAWSPDGTLLAGVTNDFRVLIWDMKTGKVKYTLTLPDAPGLHPKGNVIFSLRSAIEWSPTSSQMLLVSNTNVVSIWDVIHNKQLMQLGTDDRLANTPPPKTKDNIFNGSWNPNVTGIGWSPNGRYIIGGYGRSHRLYAWDLQAKGARVTNDGVRMPQLIFGDSKGHNDTVIDVAWSPDGRYLASTSYDTTVIVWKVDGA